MAPPAHGVFALVLDIRAEHRWEQVLAVAREVNGTPRPVARGDGWAAVSVGDGVRPVPIERLQDLEAVERVVEVTTPYCLVSRAVHGPDGPAGKILVGGRDPAEALTVVGGAAPVVLLAAMADLADDDDRMTAAARGLRRAGVAVLLAGEFSSFGGPGDPAGVTIDRLRRIRAIAADQGLATCVEVSDASDIDRVRGLTDLIQAGSRAMQDFSLLRALGKADRPVLLRRGSGATVEEFLLAAEYVLMGGNGRVMLCESGIRTFDDGGLPRFEINAIPLLKQATHLPVLADPSHTATSRAALPAVVRAAVAAGADGVVVSVHTEGVPPGTNSIGLGRLRRLRSEVDIVAQALGRHTGSPLTVPTLS